MKPFLLLACALSLLGQSTAVFPGSVATYNQVYVASDNASTPLTGPLDNATLLLNVTSTAAFAVPTLLTVDSEQMLACTKTATTFALCASGRGVAGTAAVAHLSAAKVSVRVSAAFHNNLAAELIAAETKLKNEYPSLKDKGCKGDNFTDDTVCAQAAIDASIANKTALYCSGGPYKITGTLKATLTGTLSNYSQWAFKGDGTCILEDWSTDGSGLLWVANATGVINSWDSTEISGIVFRRHGGASSAGNPAYALRLDALVNTKVLRNKFLSDPFHPEQAFTYGLWLNGSQQGEVGGNLFIGNTTHVYQQLGVGTGYDGNGGAQDFHGNTMMNGQECYHVQGALDTWITDDQFDVCAVGLHNDGGNIKITGAHFEHNATTAVLQDGAGGSMAITGDSFYNPAPSTEISIQAGDATITGNTTINGPVLFGASACTNGTFAEPGCIFAFNHYATVPVDSSGRVMFLGNIWAGAASSIVAPFRVGQPLTIYNGGAAGSIVPQLTLRSNIGIAQDSLGQFLASGVSNVSALAMNGTVGICNSTDGSFLAITTGIGVTSGSCGTNWGKFESARLTVPRIVTNGSTPVCAAGTGGGGAGFLCTVGGSDSAGTLTITIGAAPTGTTVVTLTAPIGAPGGWHMILMPANATTAALTGTTAPFVTTNTITATLTTAAVLTAGATYSWQYLAGGS